MNPTSLLFAAALLISSAQAFAGAKITGGSKYQFGKQNATVTLSCGAISNTSKENATGTLKVQLRALDTPHTGGSIGGCVLAEYKLDGLNPGSVYNSPSKVLNTTLPKVKKAYFLCFTVLEYKNGQYVLDDFQNFTNTLVLGPLPLFSMSGPWSWKTSPEGGTIDITVAKISHTRTSPTGSLSLEVWASTQPYTGGRIQGFKLGEVKKDPLKAGFVYSDVKNTAKYKAPPPGTYFVTLLLCEFNDGSYKIETYLASGAASMFK